jgi:hypothetical protein
MVPRRALAGSRLRRQCLDPHALHQRSDVPPSDMYSLAVQLIAQHARTHEGMLQVQFIEATHRRQVGVADGARQVTEPRLIASNSACRVIGRP